MSGRLFEPFEPQRPMQQEPSQATQLDQRRAELRVRSYQPDNWYWIVGGSADQVYSSARAGYVPVNDPAYVAWLAEEETRQPTKIAVEADLFDVLRKQYPKGLKDAAIIDWTLWTGEEVKALKAFLVASNVLSAERADILFSSG